MNGAASVWPERVRRYGRRAAVNLAIPDEELDAETARVQGALFPLLASETTRKPARILDYGCGWGRFTAALSQMFPTAETTGYDPTPELIALAAPGAERTRFISGDSRSFFAAVPAPFDLIWIHAVLGGIPDDALPAVFMQLHDALVPGGLLFFVEDTLPLSPSNAFWRVREERTYLALAANAGLSGRITGTLDTRFGGVKSVFSVRKHA